MKRRTSGAVWLKIVLAVGVLAYLVALGSLVFAATYVNGTKQGDGGITVETDPTWNAVSNALFTRVGNNETATNANRTALDAVEAGTNANALAVAASTNALDASKLARGEIPVARLDADLQLLSLRDGGGLDWTNFASFSMGVSNIYCTFGLHDSGSNGWLNIDPLDTTNWILNPR